MAGTAPETQYATAEKNVHIAFQVFGRGAHDLVFVPPFLSNVEVWWELPIAARFFNRLASFARVILLDKRGTGLSDRLSTVETPEERMDDIRAVMDAVGSKRAAIFGSSEGVAIAIIFAATYPARATALLLWGGMARNSPAPDYPWSVADDLYTQVVELSSSQWGTGFTASLLYPSGADEPGIRDWFAHYERVSASPGGLARHLLNNTALDIRPILPSIQTPTLLIHPENDTFVPVGGSRYLAAHIPGAKYLEPPGHDHLFCGENGDLLAEEIEEFLTGSRQLAAPNRMLATVLHIDTVPGAQRDAQLNGATWSDRTERFVEAARKELRLHRGVEVDASGDRLLATFDGPARGIHCAASIAAAANRLSIQIRAGLHAGECVRIAGKLGGIALQVAAAVKDQAAPGEIAVSSTVRDLVAGSGIAFEERGKFRLSKRSSEWAVLVVVDGERPSGSTPKLDPAREAFEAAVERAVGGPRTRALAPLSKRESEVAILVGRGLTNRQVARRLLLAERTVKWHLEQVFSKLGCTSRAQVGRWISQRATADGTSSFPGAGDGAHITHEFLGATEDMPTAPQAGGKGRMLATILFTDIVGSTRIASELGDRRWHVLLHAHDEMTRHELAGFGGREIKATGDGFLATFDRPEQAIRCACSIVQRVQGIGLQVRAGLHTGEIETDGQDVHGIGVHIGARVAALAQPGEVLVTKTVVDLVSGSELRFVDRAEHELSGVAGTWVLLAVERRH